MSAPDPETGPWLVLNSGPGGAAWNMAMDEALLEAVAEIGRPVLRFYGWTEAAATFGYSQRQADLEKTTALRPLIRRPTGGGLVPHDADWTYSLVFPPGHFWFHLRAEESYRKVHEWVGLAFARLGVSTILSPCCRKEIPGQCFAGAEKYDLLQAGRKIAGAAQRRPRTGLLIQGSVQPPPFAQEAIPPLNFILGNSPPQLHAAVSNRPLRVADPRSDAGRNPRTLLCLLTEDSTRPERASARRSAGNETSVSEVPNEPPSRGCGLISKLKNRAAWETAMLETGVEVLRGPWTTWIPPEPLLQRAEFLRAEKYARADYNAKR